MYSESLFLAAVALSFYQAEQGKWGWAALWAAAAGATRPVGILMVVGLALLYLEKIEFDWRKIRPTILWLPLALLGPLSFIAYLALRFGDPFLAWKSQYVLGWGIGRGMTAISEPLHSLFPLRNLVTGNYEALNLIHLAIFGVGLLLALLSWRRLSSAYTLWALLTLLASFTLWRSMGRFAAVLFPLFITAALLLKGHWYQAILYLSVLLLALFTILYAHFYWVS
jgi:hypothetical protein